VLIDPAAFAGMQHRLLRRAPLTQPSQALAMTGAVPSAIAPYALRRMPISCTVTVIPRRVRLARGERAIWQRRFWEHLIRDDADYARHVEYCHINPVKHGLVRRVRDWPHSSFHRDVRAGLLPEDWAGEIAIDGKFGERD
jgi:hypothetical protein